MARTRSENYDGIHLGILTNAAALFSAQGYMRSSIADLADACKLSRGALYHYFDSKEAILFAILDAQDRKSTRLNSSHGYISYAVFCLKKKKKMRVYDI